MSMETTPAVKPPAGRNKLLILIGVAIDVLQAVIAIAVSAQTIRAGQRADTKASASADESEMATIVAASDKALADQPSEDAKTANYVGERKTLQTHPPATIQARKTKPTYSALVGVLRLHRCSGRHTIPMQFVYSSIQPPNSTIWTGLLKRDGHGSKIS